MTTRHECDQAMNQLKELESCTQLLQTHLTHTRLVHQLQLGLLHQLTSSDAAAAAAAAGDRFSRSATSPTSQQQRPIWHTQLQLRQTSPCGHVCVGEAAGNGVSTSVQSAHPFILSVLITNPSTRSVPTPIDLIRCVVRIQFIRRDPGVTSPEEEQLPTLTVIHPFPSLVWSPQSTLELPLTLDSHLLDHAQAYVTVGLQVHMENTDEDVLELMLNEWMLDLWDTGVLSFVSITTPPDTSTSNHKKRKHTEVDEEKAVNHTGESHIKQRKTNFNQQHQRSALWNNESRVAQIRSPSLFGSLYSIPHWFAQNLSADLPPHSISDLNSFQLNFSVPLMLDVRRQTASNGTFQCFIRHILNLLFPCHAISFTPDSISRLSSTVMSSSATQTDRAQFLTLIHGRPVEWQLDHKSATGSASSTLLSIRVRSSLPMVTLLKLRECILTRLCLGLFGQAAMKTAVNSSSVGSSLSLPTISLRRPLPTPAHPSTDETAANTWFGEYLAAGRAIAAGQPIPTYHLPPLTSIFSKSGSTLSTSVMATNASPIQSYHTIFTDSVKLERQLKSNSSNAHSSRDLRVLFAQTRLEKAPMEQTQHTRPTTITAATIIG